MGATQLRHFKLWFAGKLKNWDLANYEVVEIRRSFDAAAEFYPEFQNGVLGKLITDVSAPALAKIDKSIKAKDSAAFFAILREAHRRMQQLSSRSQCRLHRNSNSDLVAL